MADLPNQNFEKHKDLDGDFEKNTKIYTEILKKTQRFFMTNINHLV